MARYAPDGKKLHKVDEMGTAKLHKVVKLGSLVPQQHRTANLRITTNLSIKSTEVSCVMIKQQHVNNLRPCSDIDDAPPLQTSFGALPGQARTLLQRVRRQRWQIIDHARAALTSAQAVQDVGEF